MKINLKIWRQASREMPGKMVNYTLDEIIPELSFLEMLDILNEDLLKKGEEPIAFDHDCREGICGACSLYINGRPHGPEQGVTSCQLHLRSFKDGDTIYVEPWRAKPFPVLKDLVVDRSAFDRIIQAGGYISVNTGSAPDANIIPIPNENVKEAFDAKGISIPYPQMDVHHPNAS
jgi:succinate dehydrogenase / fumarate reductase iron-sulfur subunit